MIRRNFITSIASIAASLVGFLPFKKSEASQRQDSFNPALASAPDSENYINWLKSFKPNIKWELDDFAALEEQLTQQRFGTDVDVHNLISNLHKMTYVTRGITVFGIKDGKVRYEGTRNTDIIFSSYYDDKGEITKNITYYIGKICSLSPRRSEIYKKNGVYHREYGPAITYWSGNIIEKEWFTNGCLISRQTIKVKCLSDNFKIHDFGQRGA